MYPSVDVVRNIILYKLHLECRCILDKISIIALQCIQIGQRCNRVNDVEFGLKSLDIGSPFSFGIVFLITQHFQSCILKLAHLLYIVFSSRTDDNFLFIWLMELCISALSCHDILSVLIHCLLRQIGFCICMDAF